MLRWLKIDWSGFAKTSEMFAPWTVLYGGIDISGPRLITNGKVQPEGWSPVVWREAPTHYGIDTDGS